MRCPFHAAASTFRSNVFEGYILPVRMRLWEDKETVQSYFSMTDCMHHGAMTLPGQTFNLMTLYYYIRGLLAIAEIKLLENAPTQQEHRGSSIFFNTSITEFNCDKKWKEDYDLFVIYTWQSNKTLRYSIFKQKTINEKQQDRGEDSWDCVL